MAELPRQQEEPARGEADQRVELDIYASPFTATLKRLKWVSLTSSAACLLSVPLLLSASTAEVVESARLVASGAILTTGLGSTALLTACLKTYVTHMSIQLPHGVSSLDALTHQWSTVDEEDDEARQKLLCDTHFRFTTMDLFGRARTSTMALADLAQSDATRPFTTWKNIHDGRYLFLHIDVLLAQAVQSGSSLQAAQTLVKLIHQNLPTNK